MVYHRFTLNEFMKPKYAFTSSGLFFMLLGFLLFDPLLIRAGNILVFISVLMSIKSLEYFQSILLFFVGFMVSFKIASLGIFIEMVALFIWASSKISRTMLSPVRLVKGLFSK
ncbi:hypothetical protein NEAUS03_0937 [Nematocida ausubeli]|nr:hypothetical protein NEAUS03_0937 [Nematocida ausubeli]